MGSWGLRQELTALQNVYQLASPAMQPFADSLFALLAEQGDKPLEATGAQLFELQGRLEQCLADEQHGHLLPAHAVTCAHYLGMTLPESWRQCDTHICPSPLGRATLAMNPAAWSHGWRGSFAMDGDEFSWIASKMSVKWLWGDNVLWMYGAVDIRGTGAAPEKGNTIAALHPLRLKLQLPWPLSLVVQEHHVEQYNDVLTFLLQVKLLSSAAGTTIRNIVVC